MGRFKTFKTVYKVSDFLSWMKNGELVLSPKFQRRPVWDSNSKSYLIDTIVRGLPIPIIILRDQPTSTDTYRPIREVVDGQQRLRTIFSFVEPDLLIDFDEKRDRFLVRPSHNPDIAKKAFKSFTHYYKSAILDYEFSVHVFESDTSDKQIYQIFARMNATGFNLNEQERLNSQYFGEYKTFVYKLAAENFDRWIKWQVFSDKDISRMKEVREINNFISLMFKGVQPYSKTYIESLYKEKDNSFEQSAEIERRFNEVMGFLENVIWKDEDIRTILTRKAFLYALFAAVYDLKFGLNSNLKKRPMKKISRTHIDRIKSNCYQFMFGEVPEKVLLAATRRTTDTANRLTLIEYLQNYDG